MAAPLKFEIIQLLRAWGEGEQQTLDKLTPLVHHELHHLSHHDMAREAARVA
jgi:hypothetical protein